MFYLDLCVAANFVVVYLISVQFILQLILCLYTIVHLLLEEFKIPLKSYTIIMSYNES